MPEIVMPRLSDSMEEGVVLKWLKSVGDEVAVGEELVEIETDKANMAYESDVAGTLTEILAQEHIPYTWRVSLALLNGVTVGVAVWLGVREDRAALLLQWTPLLVPLVTLPLALAMVAVP